MIDDGNPKPSIGYLSHSCCAGFSLFLHMFQISTMTDPLPYLQIGPTADVLIDSGARRGDLVIVDGQW